MRLERLTIAGYGRLPQGLEMRFAPGLNLVLAPNETGKSTLCDLITSLYFGFGPKKDGVHPFTPWSGGDTGGELAYRLDRGEGFVLRRHLAGRGAKLALLDGQGRELDVGEATPGEMHLGCGGGVFQTISRIQLDDLGRAFSGDSPKDLRQSQAGLMGYFFQEAATRGEVNNPVEVRASWEAERSRLYSRDRRSGKDGKRLDDEIVQAREDLARARAAEEEAARLQNELQSAEQRASTLQQSLNDKQRARREAEQHLTRCRDLLRRRDLAAEIEALANQGLASEEQFEQARELDRVARENGQAAQAGREAARREETRTQELTAGRGPKAMAEALDGLSGRRAELAANHRQQEATRLRQEERALTLTDAWGLSPTELAALPEGLAFDLSRAQEEAHRTENVAAGIREQTATLGPEPLDRAGAGLIGLLLLISGAGWAGWLGLHRPFDPATVDALTAWWHGLLTGMGWEPVKTALLAGLALVVLGGAAGAWWVVCRRRSSEWRGYRDRLTADLTRAEEAQAAAETELTHLSEPLGANGAEIDPAALSAALAEAASWVADQRAWQKREADLAAEKEDLLRSLAGWGEVGPDLDAALRSVSERLDQARRADGEAGRLKEQAAKAEETVASVSTDLKSLLEEHGWPGMAQASEARQRARRVDGLEAALAEVDKNLGGSPAEDEPADLAAAQEVVRRTASALADTEGQARENAALRARLDEQLRQLLGLETAAQAQAHLDSLLERQSHLVRRHDVLLLAEGLLRRAMDQFRLEAQPSLLRRAADYLEAATGGAWSWLGTDIFNLDRKKEPELWALTGVGASERAATVLSRGTRDQLYLSLRLALADEMTASGESLPLILDDPLVNFDDRRLEASLGIIAKVAESRQVLFLTCHEEQARVLENICQVNRLSLAKEG